MVEEHKPTQLNLFNIEKINPLVSDILTKFEEKCASTSTPILPRTKSATDHHLDLDRQDSGFKDLTQAFSKDSQFLSDAFSQDYFSDDALNEGTSASHCSTRSKNEESFKTPDKKLGLTSMVLFFEKIYRICPKDLVIGRNVGLEYFDIISELHKQQIPCLTQIINYLDIQDISSCKLVSSTWRSVCQTHKIKVLDRSSDEKLSSHGKENPSSVKREGSPNERQPFNVLPLNSPESPKRPSSHSPDNNANNPQFDRFIKEAKKLKTGEQLMKCPRCMGPALILPVEGRAKCKKPSCLYDYCIECHTEYHKALPCPGMKIKLVLPNQDRINSKKSKCRLRRL